MNNLEEIKKYFETRESCKASERVDGIDIFHSTLAFYTYSKRYAELENHIELMKIAHWLNFPIGPYYDEYILRQAGQKVGHLGYRLAMKIKEQRLPNKIIDLIVKHIKNGQKFLMFDRVNWEMRKENNRFYCRRRLSLCILPKEGKNAVG